MKTQVKNQLNKVVHQAFEFNDSLDIDKANGIPLNTPKDYIENSLELLSEIYTHLGINSTKLNLDERVRNGENNISQITETKKYGEVFLKVDLIKDYTRTYSLKLVGRGVAKEYQLYKVFNTLNFNTIVVPKLFEGSTEKRWFATSVIPLEEEFSFLYKFQPSSRINEKILTKVINGVEELQGLNTTDISNKVNLKAFTRDIVKDWLDNAASFILSYYPEWKTDIYNIILNPREDIFINQFCHGDLSLQNIALSNNKIVFLDWEKAQINHKFHDLSHLYVQLTMYPQLQSLLLNKVSELNSIDTDKNALLASSIGIRLLIELSHVLDGYGPCRLIPLLETKTEDALKGIIESYANALINCMENLIEQKHM